MRVIGIRHTDIRANEAEEIALCRHDCLIQALEFASSAKAAGPHKSSCVVQRKAPASASTAFQEAFLLSLATLPELPQQLPLGLLVLRLIDIVYPHTVIALRPGCPAGRVSPEPLETCNSSVSDSDSSFLMVEAAERPFAFGLRRLLADAPVESVADASGAVERRRRGSLLRVGGS